MYFYKKLSNCFPKWISHFSFHQQCVTGAVTPYPGQHLVCSVFNHFNVWFLIVVFCCCCLFVFGCIACEILVPKLGIKPMPPAVEVQSLNHWTSREVSRSKMSRFLFWDPQELYGRLYKLHSIFQNNSHFPTLIHKLMKTKRFSCF